MFVRGRLFQPSLILVGKEGTYLSEEPFSCSTLHSTLGLTHKHETRLEKPGSNKHSDVLQISVNDVRKKFYKIEPLVINFFVLNLQIFVLSQSVC